MGKSKSIKKQEKTHDEFRDYMEKVREKGSEVLGILKEKVRQNVEDHYEKNKWDYDRFFGAEKDHYHDYKEWGLDRINEIITKICDSLFAGQLDEIEGTEGASGDTKKQITEHLDGLEDLKILVVKKLNTVISAVLTQFTSVQVGARDESITEIVLPGGIHLFFGAASEVISSKGFLTKNYISSNQLVYAVYFSISEARAVSLNTIIKSTQEQIDKVSIVVDFLTDKWMNAVLVGDDTTAGIYSARMDDLKQKLDDLMNEYKKHMTIVKKVETAHAKLQQRGRVNTNELPLQAIFTENELPLAQALMQEKLAV